MCDSCSIKLRRLNFPSSIKLWVSLPNTLGAAWAAGELRWIFCSGLMLSLRRDTMVVFSGAKWLGELSVSNRFNWRMTSCISPWFRRHTSFGSSNRRSLVKLSISTAERDHCRASSATRAASTSCIRSHVKAGSRRMFDYSDSERSRAGWWTRP